MKKVPLGSARRVRHHSVLRHSCKMHVRATTGVRGSGRLACDTSRLMRVSRLFVARLASELKAASDAVSSAPLGFEEQPLVWAWRSEILEAVLPERSKAALLHCQSDCPPASAQTNTKSEEDRLESELLWTGFLHS
jgi:hypothetical protein